jgi:hypothetical protein
MGQKPLVPLPPLQWHQVESSDFGQAGDQRFRISGQGDGAGIRHAPFAGGQNVYLLHPDAPLAGQREDTIPQLAHGERVGGHPQDLCPPPERQRAAHQGGQEAEDH